MTSGNEASSGNHGNGIGDLRAFLEGDAIGLFDGAMGTMLYSKGVFINRPFEELNLTQPGRVREVHAAYRAAGAQILETNTFAANRFRLSPHGLADDVGEINRRAVELALEIANDHAWVAGAMGPLGVRIEPFGPIGRDEAAAVFREQAQHLVDAGAHLLVLETFTHLPELEEAVRAVRALTDRPIVAEVAVTGGGVTREGVSAGDVASRLTELGADVIGVNCSDPLATLEALAEMRAATRVPLAAQPNAGQPRSVEGRKIYLASPEYLVAWGRRAIRTGARLVGGCCGTTDEHIRALSQLTGEPVPKHEINEITTPRTRPPAATPVPHERKSILAAAIGAGRFVTGVELPPLRGWVADDVVNTARKLALGGITFVSVAEGSPHGAHLPPLAQAQLCRQVGVEALVHYSCRGRRLARMQTDLLGAYAVGVTNLLAVTGQPFIPGVEQDAWPDLEVDSIGLVNLAVRLNHGEDLGGNPIGRPTGFHVGVRLNPTPFDLDRERRRMHWKVDAGAEFALTSPVFDPSALQGMLAYLERRSERLPTIATVWPLLTAREAEFFERQTGLVSVPSAIVDRMRAAEKRGDEELEGLSIARELAQTVRPMVEGIQVVAPAGRADIALSVVDVLR